MNTELDDFSNAVGHLDQSYFFTGFAAAKLGGAAGSKSFYNASAGADVGDDGDTCSVASSAIVCAGGSAPAVGGGDLKLSQVQPNGG